MSDKINFKIKNINESCITSVSYKDYFIYCLRDVADNSIRYVGKTSDIVQTKNRHYSKCFEFNLKLEIIAKCYSNCVAEFIESHLIKELHIECDLINIKIPL